MRSFALTILIPLTCAFAAIAQPASPRVNSDPDKAKFVTSDIDNFWRAYDLAARETDRSAKAAIYQREYLDKGSAGLRDFVRTRIKSADELVKAIDTLPRFYASIRPSTFRIREKEASVRKAFRKFKQIYPDALFPDVYYVIGTASTGGTASESGLLIGTELYGSTEKTPRDEFAAMFRMFMPNVKDEAGLRTLAGKFAGVALKTLDGVPAIVAHESCHFNQNYPRLTTLLAKSIQEGACDFIGEKISGDLMNPAQKAYGEKHLAELWSEFQPGMDAANERKWMYNVMTSGDRPPDLGSFMGYKITQSYYKIAKDKTAAIREMLNIKDFNAFLQKSSFGSHLRSGPGESQSKENK
jgi:hypothetical protein